MTSVVLTALIILLTLTAISYVADKAQRRGDVSHRPPPGLTLLPGDFKYESEDGRFTLHVPIVTSIVLSVVLSVLLSVFA